MEAALKLWPAGDKWMEGKFKGKVWHFEKYVAYFFFFFFADSVDNIDATFHFFYSRYHDTASSWLA